MILYHMTIKSVLEKEACICYSVSMKKEKIYIYGKHAVTEAIQNRPQSLKKVFLADEKDNQLISFLNKAKIPYSKLGSGESAGDVDKNSNHQGVIGMVVLENLVQSYEEFI